MECECASESELNQAVMLASAEDGTWLRLSNCVDAWGDGSIQVCVEVGAEGLHAVMHGVTLGIYGDTLTPFFTDLAERFRGWDGKLNWRSLEPGLEIDAVFQSGGHVELSCTVGTWRLRPISWRATASIPVDAGEQMRLFAAELNEFLRTPVIRTGRKEFDSD
ncbi:MAG TPA: DUF6228 family protein [Pseudonocardiaceae bacterium]|nr:DUF6228 family protein [Pseudonocardiaceae bacterium]